ncbi:MAG: PAS domain-containing sensor histidine kinase [Planctomycetota bacterium]
MKKRSDAMKGKLEESREWLAATLKCIADAVMVTDAEGRVKFINPVAQRMTGWSAADAADRPLEEVLRIVDVQTAARVPNPAVEAIRTRSAIQLKEHILLSAKNDERHHVADSAAPIMDEAGNVVGVVLVFADVTEEHETRETLRRERDFAEGLIQAVPVMALVVDPQCRIIRCNAFAEKVTGYREEELRGKDCASTLLPHEDRPLCRQMCREILSSGELTITSATGTIVTKDGNCCEIERSHRALKDEHGGVANLLCIGHDVTDLKKAQRAALEAERLAAIGQMVAGLAHESRNALQRSQACLETLALEVRENPTALDYVSRIQDAQDHLHHLYEEVRRFAAPIKLEREPLDLGAVLQQTWSYLQAQRKARNVRLRVDHGHPPSPCPCACHLDPFAMEQVFRNILENSLAACSDPVRIDVMRTEGRLRGRPGVQIAIRDNGPGLDAEQKRRIFEPFYTTKTRGTGLGMAIAKRLVEAHGGRIAVGPGAGCGTEILITLPKE